jgi:hypothetical protein
MLYVIASSVIFITLLLLLLKRVQAEPAPSLGILAMGLRGGVLMYPIRISSPSGKREVKRAKLLFL